MTITFGFSEFGATFTGYNRKVGDIFDEARVYTYVKTQKRAVSVSQIKKGLKVTKANVVERAVLRDLNDGRLELTPDGLKVRT